MRFTAVATLALYAVALAGAWNHVQSRDGVIAYGHRGADDRFRIFVTEADKFLSAGRPLALGRSASSPRWSSDGRRLLFVKPDGIYVAEALGGGPSLRIARVKRITKVLADWGLDWSSDGTAVVLTRTVRQARCSDLYRMQADGSRLRPLLSSRLCEKHPAWSPDGLEIAFEQEDETSDIVVADVDGRNSRVLGEGTFPAWSPDGRSLAFLTADAIVVVDARTGSVQRTLKPDVPYDRLENGLTWSPEGTRLVHGFHDLQETFPLTHLGVMRIDGTDSFRLTALDTFPDMEPDWQPICTLYGTEGDDVLTGTPGDDLICGLRGNDRIRAGGGDDTVLGGDGHDSVVGGPGSDRLFGAAGNDRIYASDAEADVVNGGPGHDRVWVDGADTVSDAEERRG